MPKQSKGRRSAATPELPGLSAALGELEQAIDKVQRRLEQAEDDDEVARLANALSRAVSVLITGYRAVNSLNGSSSPIQDALRELKSVDFGED